ncbi:zinc finger HIT domain-containing protein 3 isoform X1 [Dendroctonus ponderosae]|uniref:HIT-type domain-containing protein n=1 Tax=Dendroctonus ponderosae TaxID=77166 RepID=A0AAR5QB37_DENPD|nr:zinc finger HIT domain-containing protein 3 isoform X1 [Dendroctonus ponderosae]
MPNACIICTKSATYKCPMCYIYYCSAKCCKQHRGDGCKLLSETAAEPVDESIMNFTKHFGKASEEVPEGRLQLLKQSDEVKNLITNPHLRNLLVTIDNAENPEEIVQKAMLEPIFVEFTDACMKAVEPENTKEEPFHT